MNGIDKLAAAGFTGLAHNALDVPEHMHDLLARYVLNGVPGGDFLRYVLENNLYMAMAKADYLNLAALPEWGAVLNAMPMRAWGSEAKVAEWIKAGGLEGLSKRSAEEPPAQEPQEDEEQQRTRPA